MILLSIVRIEAAKSQVPEGFFPPAQMSSSEICRVSNVQSRIAAYKYSSVDQPLQSTNMTRLKTKKITRPMRF